MTYRNKMNGRPVLVIFLCAMLCMMLYHATNGSSVVQKKIVFKSETFESEYFRHIYVITPTFKRPEQIPELVRLSQTLMLVPNLTWLVIEDGYERNELVENILKKFGSRYQYLLAPMPEKYKSRSQRPRGVSNRNKGLEWIRNYTKTGVVYFADDDNTYDIELFREIRKTRTVSMFPVGLVTELGLSSPIVQNCTFTGFYDGWIAGRKFPVDMAGFAVSVEFLLSRPNAKIPYEVGYEEDGFLKSLSPLEPSDIQLLASCCSKILVWHTQTVKNKPAKISHSYDNTNIEILTKLIV